MRELINSSSYININTSATSPQHAIWKWIFDTLQGGREGAYDMAVFGICQFGSGDTVIWIKNGRYSVFQSPNGDGKIQFLIENTTVTVLIQKFDYGITVIYEKINGNTVIQNLVRPPPP